MSQKRMRFTVMRVHSEYLPRFALTLIGRRADGQYIVPRYIEKRYDEQALRIRAASLNLDIEHAGKLLEE